MIALASVYAAAERIAPYVERTPILHSAELDHEAGLVVYAKADYRQLVKSFKIRGALNAALLAPKNVKGFIGFSSGNHAQALAYAGQLLGKPTTLIMPEDTPRVKVEATKRFGATVVTDGVTIANRLELLEHMAADSGFFVIKPYDDENVMAGQGTMALEFLEQCPDITAVYMPVGGGGLISGIASVVKQLRPDIAVIGVEPEGANDAQMSLATKTRVALPAIPSTVCDGIRTLTLGEKTFPIIVEAVDEIVAVPDVATLRAVELVRTYFGDTIETTGAISLGALLTKERDRGTVLTILTGANC